MGNPMSKTARTPPARFIAKQLPRPALDVAEDFKKAKHTIEGINRETEKVITTPQPYVETKRDAESTNVPDHAAPRWYLNTWMEMMDNTRQDRVIISGNLPISWERDRFEPYSLVRNRIDDEDLDWLLGPEAQAMKKEDLVEHTKLELSALEDILATVEAPRRQFRNYQGKLHKSIDDPNQFLTDRKKRVEENREDELLRSIGMSEDEINDDKQYREKRSRGVKALDDLGVTLRAKKRSQRLAHFDDMQSLIEARNKIEIESGQKTEITENDIKRDDNVKPSGQFVFRNNRRLRANHRKQFAMDLVGSPEEQARIQWWQDRRREIPHGPDVIHDADVYAEHLTQTEDQLQREVSRTADVSKGFAAAQGAKGYFDPRLQYEEMIKMMREAGNESKKTAAAASRANVPVAGGTADAADAPSTVGEGSDVQQPAANAVPPSATSAAASSMSSTAPISPGGNAPLAATWRPSTKPPSTPTPTSPSEGGSSTPPPNA